MFIKLSLCYFSHYAVQHTALRTYAYSAEWTYSCSGRKCKCKWHSYVGSCSNRIKHKQVARAQARAVEVVVEALQVIKFKSLLFPLKCFSFCCNSLAKIYSQIITFMAPLVYIYTHTHAYIKLYFTILLRYRIQGAAVK